MAGYKGKERGENKKNGITLTKNLNKLKINENEAKNG